MIREEKQRRSGRGEERQLSLSNLAEMRRAPARLSSESAHGWPGAAVAEGRLWQRRLVAALANPLAFWW
jgi:hypothetical protein